MNRPKLALSTALVQDNVPALIPGVNKLYIGSIHAAFNIDALKELGITHILNASGLPPTFPRNFTYLSIDLRDKSFSHILGCIPAANIFIESGLPDGSVEESATTRHPKSAGSSRGGGVLVHCAGGRSRSAAFCMAFMMSAQGLSFEAAMATCRNARPLVQVNLGFQLQLRAYAVAGCDVHKAHQILLHKRLERFGERTYIAALTAADSDTSDDRGAVAPGKDDADGSSSNCSSQQTSDSSRTNLGGDGGAQSRAPPQLRLAPSGGGSGGGWSGSGSNSRYRPAGSNNNSSSSSSGGGGEDGDGVEFVLSILDQPHSSKPAQRARLRLSKPGSAAVQVIPPLRALERPLTCRTCATKGASKGSSSSSSSSASAAAAVAGGGAGGVSGGLGAPLFTYANVVRLDLAELAGGLDARAWAREAARERAEQAAEPFSTTPGAQTPSSGMSSSSPSGGGGGGGGGGSTIVDGFGRNMSSSNSSLSGREEETQGSHHGGSSGSSSGGMHQGFAAPKVPTTPGGTPHGRGRGGFGGGFGGGGGGGGFGGGGDGFDFSERAEGSSAHDGSKNDEHDYHDNGGIRGDGGSGGERGSAVSGEAKEGQPSLRLSVVESVHDDDDEDDDASRQNTGSGGGNDSGGDGGDGAKSVPVVSRASPVPALSLGTRRFGAGAKDDEGDRSTSTTITTGGGGCENLNTRDCEVQEQSWSVLGGSAGGSARGGGRGGGGGSGAGPFSLPNDDVITAAAERLISLPTCTPSSAAAARRQEEAEGGLSLSSLSIARRRGLSEASDGSAGGGGGGGTPSLPLSARSNGSSAWSSPRSEPGSARLSLGAAGNSSNGSSSCSGGDDFQTTPCVVLANGGGTGSGPGGGSGAGADSRRAFRPQSAEKRRWLSRLEALEIRRSFTGGPSGLRVIESKESMESEDETDGSGLPSDLSGSGGGGGAVGGLDLQPEPNNSQHASGSGGGCGGGSATGPSPLRSVDRAAKVAADDEASQRMLHSQSSHAAPWLLKLPPSNSASPLNEHAQLQQRASALASLEYDSPNEHRRHPTRGGGEEKADLVAAAAAAVAVLVVSEVEADEEESDEEVAAVVVTGRRGSFISESKSEAKDDEYERAEKVFFLEHLPWMNVAQQDPPLRQPGGCGAAGADDDSCGVYGGLLSCPNCNTELGRWGWEMPRPNSSGGAASFPVPRYAVLRRRVFASALPSERAGGSLDTTPRESHSSASTTPRERSSSSGGEGGHLSPPPLSTPPGSGRRQPYEAKAND